MRRWHHRRYSEERTLDASCIYSPVRSTPFIDINNFVYDDFISLHSFFSDPLLITSLYFSIYMIFTSSSSPSSLSPSNCIALQSLFIGAGALPLSSALRSLLLKCFEEVCNDIQLSLPSPYLLFDLDSIHIICLPYLLAAPQCFFHFTPPLLFLSLHLHDYISYFFFPYTIPALSHLHPSLVQLYLHFFCTEINKLYPACLNIIREWNWRVGS